MLLWMDLYGWTCMDGLVNVLSFVDYDNLREMPTVYLSTAIACSDLEVHLFELTFVHYY